MINTSLFCVFQSEEKIEIKWFNEHLKHKKLKRFVN
jgi:hypothetical protein